MKTQYERRLEADLLKKDIENVSMLIDKFNKIISVLNTMNKKDIGDKNLNILDDIYLKLGPQEMCKRIAELQTEDKWKTVWYNRSEYKTFSDELARTIKRAWHKVHCNDLAGSVKNKK